MSLWGNNSGTIKLQGFNNLVKNLTFTTCRIVRVASDTQLQTVLTELNAKWGTDRFCALFEKICTKLDARILNLSNYDFDPIGASVNALLADCNHTGSALSFAHLDKSHMAVHTYPECNHHTGIVTFRVDFDISTCGLISPLSIIDMLLEEIGFNVVTIDYKVRGFTRLEDGRKIYNDHEVNSISDSIGDDFKSRFQIEENNYPQIQTWQTRLMRNEIEWSDFISSSVGVEQGGGQLDLVHREMKDIFHGHSGTPSMKQSKGTVGVELGYESL